MYRVKTCNGPIVFQNLEDAVIWLVSKSGTLFVNGAFVKIERFDDFCEDYIVEELKK